MKVPVADTCCCGCRLRSGSIVIGFIALVGAVCSFIRSTELYSDLEDIAVSNDQDPNINEIKDHFLAHQLLMFGCMLSSLASTLLALTLLTGIFTERRGLVRVWVFGTLAIQLLTLVGSILYCVLLGNVSCMSLNAFLAFHLYFVWVVYSYSTEMGKETTGVA